MQEPLTVNDVLALVHKEMDAIDDVRLFYELKKRRLRYYARGKHILKAVIGLAKLGLPINTFMFKAIFPNSKPKLYALHTLGDKHLLVLKRTRRRYKWLPSKLLMEIIESIDANDKVKNEW